MRANLARLLFAALFLSWQAHAAQFVIVNADFPGEGFNDPTPAAPVGGNPGTTLGEQRLNVFLRAAGVVASPANSAAGDTRGTAASAAIMTVDFIGTPRDGKVAREESARPRDARPATVSRLREMPSLRPGLVAHDGGASIAPVIGRRNGWAENFAMLVGHI